MPVAAGVTEPHTERRVALALTGLKQAKTLPLFGILFPRTCKEFQRQRSPRLLKRTHNKVEGRYAPTRPPRWFRLRTTAHTTNIFDFLTSRVRTICTGPESQE